MFALRASYIRRFSQRATPHQRTARLWSFTLDLSIPKISGYTVLALYPPKKNKTPIIVFSASEREADVSRAMSLGASEFIHKPMDLDEYKGAVFGMVQKWTCHHTAGMESVPS